MRKMTVVGREKMVVFDDMEPERKLTVYEKSAGPAGELYSGDISIPKIATDEPLRLECAHFLQLIAGQGDRDKVARDGARVVRALEMLTNSLAG
jgi:predicted dehydrogenase